jgi:TonB family protein
MVGIMRPLAAKEIRVVKNQTSFVVAGWLVGAVVLAGGIGGGMWLWPRVKAASQTLRAPVAETKPARQRPVPVSEEVQQVAPPTAEPARSADETTLDSVGRKGLEPRRVPRPPTTGQGALGRAEIQRVLRGHMAEIKACYEAGRKIDPNLDGQVTVQFVIGARGQVSSSTIKSSSLGNIRTETCLVQAIRRWEFPPPRNGVDTVIVYPFVFKRATG